MEIGPDRSRRWAGWVGYLLFIAVVAGAFIWLFAHFTLSWKIATGVVAVMLTYMVLMAWWAGRGGVGGGGMSS